MQFFLHGIILAALLAAPPAARATSYPAPEERTDACRDVPMSVGKTVILFQSGTADVKKNLARDGILSVFRNGPSCEPVEVGKIRVRSLIRDYYAEAEVVEGEVRSGDVAIQGGAGYLVTTRTGKCGH